EIFVYVANKQKEIEELRRMEQFRREFLADVSHELKTPVFSAQGFIHTLLEGAMDDEQVRERFLVKAAKSLERLDILVKDLVSLSQLESGETTMVPEKVNMAELTAEIFERLEKIAKQRDVTLKIKPERLTSVWVLADKQRIDQVMVNLISNAIKYNNDGGKVVVLFEEDKKNFTISVRDNGPGISQEHIARIFERFYRVDKSRSRDLGGTGLGLAIVKHILNAHGTTITVMSQVGKGTNFSFKLPKG
ncbi:MAG: two-component sensor histidine kinase, partial [Cytophagaceae bacterium SCN 52-12]